MSLTACYVPPANTLWQGRADLPEYSCFYQIVQLLNLQHSIPNRDFPAFAFLGFCCDEGVSRNQGRTGAAEGPDAIRTVLAKLPIQRQQVICYDAGNISCADGDLEHAQKALADAVHILLKHNITPIVLGGGHELAWGHYQGIEKKFPNSELGIINFDAHFDMRPLLPDDKGSSGTPFLQIAHAHEKARRSFDYNCIGIQRAGNIPSLFATANAWNVHMLLADDVHQNRKELIFDFIQRIIEQNTILYLSLCMDVFAAPYAPGVSAPQSFGLTPWQVVPLVRQLAESGKVVSYDLAELSPKFDRDQRTAKLAANFIFEIIHHHKF